MEKSGIQARFLASIDHILDKNSDLTKTKLAEVLGCSRTKLSEIMANRMMAGTDIISKLCIEYHISPSWLLTGEGDMLKQHTPQKEQTKSRQEAEMIPTISTCNDTLDNAPLIPLVTQNAVAGFGNENFTIQEADVKEYYVVPKFRYHQVDFMIEISGSSMYPKYNSGDVVACTILHDGAFIQWNKCHIVATREQGILCKRLMPGASDDCLKMVSDNPNYPPFDVPKNEITGIALIVGVIRLE